jgi:hypothetical protein
MASNARNAAAMFSRIGDDKMAKDYSIGSDNWNGLNKVIEEMGELGQVCGKAIGSGGDTSPWSGALRDKFVEELSDVQAALNFFIQHNMTSDEQTQIKKRAKKKFNRFCDVNKAERAKRGEVK